MFKIMIAAIIAIPWYMGELVFEYMNRRYLKNE